MVRNAVDLGCAAALFRGLAHRVRLAICLELAHKERSVADLAGTLCLAQSTASGHLAGLRDSGLVVGRRDGRQVMYSLAHPELIDLLISAERLLERTCGRPVPLCSIRIGLLPDIPEPRDVKLPD